MAAPSRAPSAPASRHLENRDLKGNEGDSEEGGAMTTEERDMCDALLRLYAESAEGKKKDAA